MFLVVSFYDTNVHLNVVKYYKCIVSTCPEVFKSENDRENHMKSHHLTSETTDEVCPVVKRRKVNTEFVCTIEGCPRTFKYKKNLSAHILAVHENDGRFACTYPGCDKVFGFHHVLVRHVLLVHEV